MVKGKWFLLYNSRTPKMGRFESGIAPQNHLLNATKIEDIDRAMEEAKVILGNDINEVSSPMIAYFIPFR